MAQTPAAIPGPFRMTAVDLDSIVQELNSGMFLLLNYGMSLKRSESSERARQTGSTALKGTSRNAPKTIKRLSHVSDDGAFLDVHFCRELPGVLEVCGSGRPPWAQPPHRTLLAGRFRPRSGSIYQSRILAVPALQQHHRPSVPLPSRPTIRRSIVCFLRVFLGLGAGRDVGRWPNGRAGVARDRGCAGGRSGRWADPIRSAIGW